MRAIKNILVPTDFSETSTEALELAIEMAQRFEASITLLHVYEFVVYPLPEAAIFGAPPVMVDIRGPATEALEELRVRTARRVPTSARLAEGSADDEVVRVATEGDFDLIVIGTHGRTGLSHMLMGSTTEKIVRTAPCPVLSLRVGQTHATRSADPEHPLPTEGKLAAV